MAQKVPTFILPNISQEEDLESQKEDLLLKHVGNLILRFLSIVQIETITIDFRDKKIIFMDSENTNDIVIYDEYNNNSTIVIPYENLSLLLSYILYYAEIKNLYPSTNFHISIKDYKSLKSFIKILS